MANKWSNYVNTLLDGFRNMRESEEIPDQVILVCEGKEYRAGKTMLMAGCLYFKTFFTSQFADVKDSKISLPEITSYAMNFVLDFIYCNQPEVPNHLPKFFEIFKAAQFFQLTSLEEICVDEFKIKVTNCTVFCLWKSVRESGEFPKLIEILVSKVIENFGFYVKTSFFLWFDFEQVSLVLSSAAKNSCKVGVILSALQKWVEFIPNERKCLFRGLFEAYVDIRLFAVNELTALIVQDNLVDVKQLLQTEIEVRMNNTGHNLSNMNSRILFLRSNATVKETNLFCYCVESDEWTDAFNLQKYFDFTDSWKPLAFFNGSFFVESMGIVQKFELWSFVKSVIQFPKKLHRCLLLLPVGEDLYCVADSGINKSHTSILKYDSEKDAWTLLTEYNGDFFFNEACGTSLSGKLYFYRSRGSSLLVYDIVSNVCSELPFKTEHWPIPPEEKKLWKVSITVYSEHIFVPISSSNILQYNPRTGKQRKLQFNLKLVGLWGLPNYLLLLDERGGMYKLAANVHSCEDTALVPINGFLSGFNEHGHCFKALFSNHTNELLSWVN